MELRQMRYVVAVAEELHFGRAAERLHVSTPTLSQQVKAVEREIGAPLFVRHSRGVRLTPAGEAFVRTAGETLHAAERALRETRRAAGVAAPVLRLGLLNGVPPALPDRVGRLLAERGRQMSLHGGTTAAQLRMLENAEVDLALIRLPSSPPSGIRSMKIAEEDLGVLMAEANPLSRHEVLDVAALAGQELILFARESAPEVHDAMVRVLGPGVTLSPSAMAHAQLRAVLPLKPHAFSLGSPRAAAPPDLVWRPLRDAVVRVGYAVAWRSADRDPVLQDLLHDLEQER